MAPATVKTDTDTAAFATSVLPRLVPAAPSDTATLKASAGEGRQAAVERISNAGGSSTRSGQQASDAAKKRRGVRFQSVSDDAPVANDSEPEVPPTSLSGSKRKRAAGADSEVDDGKPIAKKQKKTSKSAKRSKKKKA